MKFRILLVEDERGLVIALRDRLKSEGYAVETAPDGITGFERAAKESFDLILLDVMLPGKDGLDVCRDLRQLKITTPILMLTARGQIYDKVLGLKIGADDYLTKPFDMAELLARVEAQLRRNPSQTTSGNTETYRFGTVSVDFRRAEVIRDGRKIELPAREFKLLRYLIQHRGMLCTRNQLLDEVWGCDVNVTTRTVDVHIAWLRQKLEENPPHPQYLLTVYGLGYKFAD
jgi:two-component system, OmpR family, alkaline phosphatase synthesis response regulator PhoP